MYKDQSNIAYHSQDKALRLLLATTSTTQVSTGVRVRVRVKGDTLTVPVPPEPKPEPPRSPVDPNPEEDPTDRHPNNPEDNNPEPSNQEDKGDMSDNNSGAVNKPNQFEGDKGKSKEFLDKLYLYFAGNSKKIQTDKDKVQYALSYIKRPA
ncbi:uncharacterized protein FIBRA_09028 [Fibroporia radiculosa]|uniref:Uncharacterized protein n=1 Tax=Fibroporia radiculosa TaxID=599839 RepID=J4H5H2_9APHY|nr:uncharacterized protein FIBRA_09028 [Fibroporia radiculosa]CCM06734.1 predicted protein [Fibroporia radiculosa]